ncbi:MAG: hypothetical protein LBF34_02060 [Puniceicoccales bacterium]|nr:hypothetical protein [Puniceicoccales bacterium]
MFGTATPGFSRVTPAATPGPSLFGTAATPAATPGSSRVTPTAVPGFFGTAVPSFFGTATPGLSAFRLKPDWKGEERRRRDEFIATLAPQGLKMEWDLTSAFQENLCGYSALLAALKINEIPPEMEGNVTIIIKHSEVRQFFETLHGNLQRYCIDIGNIGEPLDIIHLENIAIFLGLHIILYITNYTDRQIYNPQEYNPDKPEITRIYLCCGCESGHYQIVTPQNITVRYVDDDPIREDELVRKL